MPFPSAEETQQAPMLDVYTVAYGRHAAFLPIVAAYH